MDPGYANYREKWRLRRHRSRLRRVPLIAGGVALLIVLGVLSARGHRPQLGAVAWVYGDRACGPPHIGLGEGALVVAWEYGSVAAQAAATGLPLWGAPVDRAQQFDGPPSVGADRIVLGGSDGYVRCLELKTGQVAWGFDAQTIVRSTPLIADDRVYVGGDDGRLYCLALADGTLVWAYPPVDEADRGAVLGGAAIADGTIVFGSCEREAVGLDLATGKLRWRVAFGGPVVARPTAEGGLVYLAAENGDVRCVAAKDGQPVWEKAFAFLTRQPVLVSGSRAYILPSDGTVYCVDAKTGRDVWRRRLHGRPTTAPVTDGRRLYVGTSRNLVEALSLDSGRSVWRWRPGSKPLGDLLLDSQHLYCTTAAREVYAVRIGESR